MDKKPCHIHPQTLVESRQICAVTHISAFAYGLKGAGIGCNCNTGDHCSIENSVKIGDKVVIKNGLSILGRAHNCQ